MKNYFIIIILVTLFCNHHGFASKVPSSTKPIQTNGFTITDGLTPITT